MSFGPERFFNKREPDENLYPQIMHRINKVLLPNEIPGFLLGFRRGLIINMFSLLMIEKQGGVGIKEKLFKKFADSFEDPEIQKHLDGARRRGNSTEWLGVCTETTVNESLGAYIDVLALRN